MNLNSIVLQHIHFLHCLLSFSNHVNVLQSMIWWFVNKTTCIYKHIFIYFKMTVVHYEHRGFAMGRLGDSGVYIITVKPLLTSCLHHSLQDDHNLKVFLLQLGLWHVPEGWVCINLMGYHQRWNQEETVITCLEAHTDVCLVQRDEFTWRRQKSGQEIARSFSRGFSLFWLLEYL